MFARPTVVRRRPLLRAAAIGGTYAAGRAMGRRSAEAQAGNQDQQQAQQASEPDQASPGTGNSAVLDQLGQLTAMHQQGALTDQEFAAAKAKILGA
jgi:hypothetical protein